MAKSFLRLAALICLSLTGPIAAGPARAQQAPAAPAAPAPAAPAKPVVAPPEFVQSGAALDKANDTLTEIEKGLERPHLSDVSLVGLRDAATPVAAELTTITEKITPRLAELKARLDQLGPAPDAKAPPESQAVADERANLQQSFANADEIVKRAKLLAVRVDQIKTSVAAKRRALFARSLFQRSASIVDPTLWRDTPSESLDNLRATGALFADWIARINARFDGWRRAAFWLCIPAVFLAYVPLVHYARRVLARRTEEKPTRLRKAFGAWWIALLIAVPPTALTYLIVFALDAANLTSYRVHIVFAALVAGVARVAAAAGLSRGLFAPSRPGWRLSRVGDAAAARLVSVTVTVAAIMAATRILEALNDAVDASLAFSVATRGVGALVGALALGSGLWRIGADSADRAPGARGVNWFVILRAAALFASFVIVVAVFVGYPTFASFFLDQVLWIAGVVAVYVLFNALVEESALAGFTPEARVGAFLVTRIGLRRDSLELLGVILSGVLRVILLIVAVVAILAPWGLQSADVPLDLRNAFFGFTIADVTISPASICGALGVLALVYSIVHAFRRWLETKLLPQTRLDAGLRNSIVTSVGYIGFLLAIGLSLGYLGLSFERLAIVAGALSVGIGFGLQSIVNNFVSGLILLWERAVRVGDWIVVGGDQGFVRRINVRSTEIETVDRAQVIIPNSSLISGVVKNMVRNDRTGRAVIAVAVNGSADPEAVRETLFSIARDDDRVLRIPAPQIFFTGMSGAALNFELAAFVADVETLARVRSDLHFAIFKEFKARKFFDGPAAGPQQIEIVGAPAVGFAPPERDKAAAG
ncbi:DUF3772 domain-containing protein [Methylocella sp.]|uniref:DUF3772 domain-containing protein n=1 Tax=Methylocella sp. TaxID=1978226 RepID=UPI003782D305